MLRNSSGKSGKSRLLLGLSLLLALVTASSGEVVFNRSGELTASDPKRSDNSYYDRYTISVSAGDRLRIDLESSDFDAYLIVTLPGGEQKTNDDISSSITNSRLEFTVATDGALTIDANSVAAGSTGSYRLKVDRLSSSVSTSSTRSVPPPSRQGASRQGAPASVPTSVPPPSRMGAPSAASSTSASASSTSTASSTPSGGDWISGRLDAGDQTHSDGSYIDEHTFNGVQGEVVTIILESTDFDPYLFLLGPDEFRESNDDADGKNSRITATLPRNGSYRVVVNSYGEGPHPGSYRLRIGRSSSGAGSSNASRNSNASSTPISLGSPVSGRLSAGDATYSDGSFIDVYTFRGRAGQTVSARLESTDFDPMLFLAGPSEFSESNDDADGKNSIISTILPSNGEYRLTVNSYGAGGNEGGYRLIVTEGGSGTPSTTSSNDGTRIRLGEPVDGSLASGDATLPSGEFSDVYTLSARAGQSFAIDLSSTDFDPYLLVRGPGNFREDNDDFNDQRNRSRIEFSAPEDGLYRISATSYATGSTGRYRLIATDLQGERTSASATATTGLAGTDDAATTRIEAGRALSGRLSATSGTLNSGEYRDLYTYRGRRGEQLVIEMTSTEIDPFLLVRGQGLSEDNDDAGDGVRDARISVTLPADGDYKIFATTFRPAEAGAYRISITSGASSVTPSPERPIEPTRPSPTRPEPPTSNSTPRLTAARAFGIFVGITDYRGDGDLPQCAEDARKFAEVLRSASVMTTAQQRVLLDRAATVAAVRTAFRELAAQAGPDDLFIFFYSGHGSQTEDLSTSNERDRREESLVLYDQLLQDDEMATLLGSLRSRVCIVALDACFSGGFRDALTRPEQMGLFSSEEDLTSAVPEKFLAGGYLSHFVREGLLGAADADGDNRVTAGELSEYLYREYASEVSGVRSETIEGSSSYQHLVVDRGGVKVTDLLLALGNVPTTLKFRAMPRSSAATTRTGANSVRTR